MPWSAVQTRRAPARWLGRSMHPLLVCRMILTFRGWSGSKKVTPKRREVLFDQIKEQAVAWAVARVGGAGESAEINILNARMKAMDQAIHQLNPAPDFALIDGNRNKGITIPNRMVVHGDSLRPLFRRPLFWLK